MPPSTDKPLQQLLTTIDTLDPKTLVILEQELVQMMADQEKGSLEYEKQRKQLEQIRAAIEQHDREVIDEIRKKLVIS